MLSTKNALCLYRFSNLFALQALNKASFNFLQRFFTIIVDDKNFLELDFICISRILASSELLITSELEVCNAADKWLNHNIEERCKYFKELVLKVRFNFLSADTIELLLNESTLFTKVREHLSNKKEVLDCKEYFNRHRNNTNLTSRYCNQNMFHILTCGDDKTTLSQVVSKVNQVDISGSTLRENFLSLLKERKHSSVFYVKGEVYVFGGYDNDFSFTSSVDKYSPATKTWAKVSSMVGEHTNFCACAFMRKVFIIGGYIDQVRSDCCLQFDTSDCSWKQLSKISSVRIFASCAVFEGKIVMSGGWSSNDENNNIYLKSVESYDVTPDKWSSMPDMNSIKAFHNSVAIKNKLYVISKSNICEVYDSVCKKFVIMKPPSLNRYSSVISCSIGNKIYVFQDDSPKVFYYDVIKNEWSEELCDVTINLSKFSCVKVPSLYEKIKN